MTRRRPLLEALIEALNHPAAEELADTLWLAAGLPARGAPAHGARAMSHDDREHLPDPIAIDAAGEALEDALPLARAVRLLRATEPSRTATTLDELTTAQMIAEDPDGLWLPVLRPAEEPRLDLTVIADVSASMTIWQPWISATTQLLQQAQISRAIWQSRIDTDQPQLRLSTVDGLTQEPWELIRPVPRQIILILSDCIGRAWHDGSMSRLIEIYAQAKEGIVTVIHPLPERMWTRCGPQLINATVRTKLAAYLGFCIEPEDSALASRGVAVLVIRFTADWLRWWASLVTGQTHFILPVTALYTGGSPHMDAPAAMEVPAALSPRDTVDEFRAYASPAAFELSVQLATARPPLDLPTMLSIQRSAMRPQGVHAARVHLAEIMLGNLLWRYHPEDGTRDKALYEFYPGVRATLLSYITG